MGGLAIRCAVSTSCGGSDSAAPLLRAVVMFDTPNLGTFWKGYGVSHVANVVTNFLSAACRVPDALPTERTLHRICDQIRALGTSDAAKAFTPGSDELRTLPSLPSTVPVLAVAGSVKVGTSFWGRPPKILGDAGDLVVSEDSAFASARTVGGLGGKVVRDCGVLDVTVPKPQPMLMCTHVSETNNPDWLVLVTQLVGKIDRDGRIPTKYLKEWGRHGASLTIKADGAGELSYRTYEEPDAATDMYHEYVTMRFRMSADGRSLVGTATAVRHESGSGQVLAPSGYVNVGDEWVYTVKPSGALNEHRTRPPSDGSDNAFCTAGVVDVACGA
jgi:hypothetical protein